jgi:hypothetical protein
VVKRREIYPEEGPKIKRLSAVGAGLSAVFNC